MKEETITITYDHKTKRVGLDDYVRAKTKALREFGYPTLTESEVLEQLMAIKAGKKLNVIGLFMEDEVSFDA